MNKYAVQRYTTSVVVPLNDDTHDAPVIGASGGPDELNGILKGITVSAPDLSGTALTISILGQRGEILFSKAALVENALNYIGVDANNHPLSIPLSLKGVSPVRIKSTGTANSTGTLTLDNNGAIADGETVSIGGQAYRLKLAIAQINDVLIEPDVAATGTVTSDQTNPDNGGVVRVDDQIYTPCTLR